MKLKIPFTVNALPTINVAVLDAYLTPVQCVDCKQYVPFGWIGRSTYCAATDFGHRISKDVYDHLQDKVWNAAESPGLRITSGWARWTELNRLIEPRRPCGSAPGAVLKRVLG